MVLASRSNRCLRTGSEENCAGENLDRYGAFQPRIPGPVHFAHSACTELRLNLIGPEFCPRRQRHTWPRLYSRRNPPRTFRHALRAMAMCLEFPRCSNTTTSQSSAIRPRARNGFWEIDPPLSPSVYERNAQHYGVREMG